MSFRQPGEVALTPAQRATAWFFATIAALFLAQTLLGAAAEHYRADMPSFFGLDLAALLPVQPGPHLAPAARSVLDRGLVPGRRHLPGPVRRRT